MYLSSRASRIRQREAQHARANRAEIIKALSIGQITRRDLFRWGIFTSSGLLVCKNGLSPFARSAFAQVPTGTPRSPLFNAQKFSQPMPRLDLQTPGPRNPPQQGWRDRCRIRLAPLRVSATPDGSPTTRTSARRPQARQGRFHQSHHRTGDRSKGGRLERSSPIRDGTNSSPRWATS